MFPKPCSLRKTGRALGIFITIGVALPAMSAPAPAATVGTITTIAGGRSAVTPDGAFARLAQPRTAAVAANGDVYFTDTYHHQIRRLDRSGVVTTIAGNGYAGSSGDGGPATEASLDTPHGVAVDNRGHVFIADSPNHRIRMVDLATGTIRTVAGNGQEGFGGDGGPATAARLNRPRFLIIAPDGSLLIADTANYRVRRVDPDGIITTIAGTGERGYSGDGGPATSARLDDPRGLALDRAGNLYVSNAEGSPVPAVRRIDPAGIISTVAGGRPAGFSGDGGPAVDARLHEPRSIAVWDSTLYIADSMNDRIRAVDLGSGVIRTVAGTGACAFGGDNGPATSAKLAEPRGVAVTPDGDVIVIDTGNDRLRLIDAGGSGASLPGWTGGVNGGEAAGAGSDRSETGATRPGGGYRLVATDGGIFAFGDARFLGSTGGVVLNRPIVGTATTPTRRGYWLVAADGGVFTFGDAAFLGSTGGLRLNQPIVGMAATPSGRGYWLVAADGGIFSFGDARFFGSTGAMRLQRPIVGMAATPTGAGYWLVAADGGIFAFGDAAFFGSTGGLRLVRPVVGMAGTPSGRGYWLLASDGGIFAFGDAPFLGARADGAAPSAVALAATPSGRGYRMARTDGSVSTFGDAPFLGSASADPRRRPIVGLTA
jgi:sugar lactone lactonase YvrE